MNFSHIVDRRLGRASLRSANLEQQMRHQLFFLAVTLFLATGCSTSLEVTLVGNEAMNMGGNATVVKVYQLKGDGNFRSVPFSAFWQDDEAALGGELLETSRKVTVYPAAESRTIEFDLIDKAKHIGVAANLRKPDQEDWRFIHSTGKMGDEVVVTVIENRIEVDVEERSVVRKLWDLL